MYITKCLWWKPWSLWKKLLLNPPARGILTPSLTMPLLFILSSLSSLLLSCSLNHIEKSHQNTLSLLTHSSEFKLGETGYFCHLVGTFSLTHTAFDQPQIIMIIKYSSWLNSFLSFVSLNDKKNTYFQNYIIKVEIRNVTFMTALMLDTIWPYNIKTCIFKRSWELKKTFFLDFMARTKSSSVSFLDTIENSIEMEVKKNVTLKRDKV